MNETVNNFVATHLDIGLSKEDQDRIAAIREVGKPNKAASWWKTLNDFAVGFTKINIREKVTFYQLLAVMINAGVPLIRALYVLADQNKNQRFKQIVHHLAASMEEGQSLSGSMESYPDVFSQSERGMIASGEASGNMDAILKDIAAQVNKNSLIISKVKGAMVYPISIIAIMTVALFLILTMVVPKIMELFDQAGSTLPMTTRVLIGASTFTQTHWVLILLIILATLTGFMIFRRSKRGQYLIDLGVLYLPIFGPILRHLMISRFARMLAALMRSGIPIVKALEINANAIGNEVYRQRIEFASQDVAQGIPLGENLTENAFLFPPMVVSMVLVGEQTAKLHEVADKVADYYENQVDTSIAALSKLMEPIILLIMGAVVGFIVAAIMQPIMQLSDLSSVL